MRTEIDCQTVSPEEFATVIGQWLEVYKNRDAKAPDKKAAHTAISKAIEQACDIERRDLMQSLSERDGFAVMELAAQEGLSRVIHFLHDAGIGNTDLGNSALNAYVLHLASYGNHTDAIDALLECYPYFRVKEQMSGVICTAISKKNISYARKIISETDANDLREIGNSIIESIAEHGGAELIPLVTSQGVSPDTPNYIKKPPISVAIEHARTDVVEALLDAGATTELPPEPKPKKTVNPFMNFPQVPPLVVAAMKGNLKFIDILLQAGADVTAKDSTNMTAYDWARRGKDQAVIDRLRIAMGIEEQQLDVFDLIRAAQRGGLAILEKVIEEAIDCDFCTDPGRTALMGATINGQVEAVRILLEAGASPDKQEKGKKKKSSWEMAAQLNQVEILQLFSNYSTHTRLREKALIDAAGHGNFDSVKYLLDQNINIDSLDKANDDPWCKEQKSALMVAAQKGQSKVISLLIKRGANLELRSQGMFSSTALHSAIICNGTGEAAEDEHGNFITRQFGEPVECVRLLLDAGADPNSVAATGDYPIHHTFSHYEITKMLVDAGADINSKDKIYEDTALHGAAINRSFDTTKLLLQAGANPNPINKKGQTPLDIARDRDLTEIAKLLEEAGGVPGMETDEGRAAVDAVFAEELSEEKRREAAIAANEELEPDFTETLKGDNYHQAIKHLESITDNQPESPENFPALAHAKVTLEKADLLLEKERSRFFELGCTLFLCGRAILPDDDALLGILPTTDPSEVIAAVGTGGPNYDIYMSEIVAELKELYEIAPFHLTQVRYDTIGLQFIKKIPKAKARKWTIRLYELCPDLVDQGFMSVTKLRQHLEKEKNLTLWWD